MLCENPYRKTGLSTMFPEFVDRALKLFPDIDWLIFAGPDQDWPVPHPRVQVNRQFPSNENLSRRLIADHFHVPVVARAEGCAALLTTGFVPMRKCLPNVLHVFSLQHLDPGNRIGFARRTYRRLVMKRSWTKADLVITNSCFAADQIRSAVPALTDKLVQSYEGLQHGQFHTRAGPNETERLRHRFAVTPGYFLWVSNFYPYKQAELLLDGYARLPQSIRRAHPLVMAGGWSEFRDVCNARVQRLGIANDVNFLGWLDDEWIAPLYRHALAFCLSSREETFGRSVIEAMACGTPCVVNDIPIMREVTDGAATVVDFRAPDRVAAALAQLAAEPAARDALVKKGLARAGQFTFEKLATERINAIRAMLAARAK